MRSKKSVFLPGLRVSEEFAQKVELVQQQLEPLGLDGPSLRRQFWIALIDALENGEVPVIPIRVVTGKQASPLAIDSAVDLSAASTTKVELTILISRLMEGEDPQALKRAYGSELLEDAISALENRM